MSNKYQPHLQVLPEDDANRQLVNGLELNLDLNPRQLQVLQPVGGWLHVLDRLTDPGTVRAMGDHGRRHLLLLIDFDDQFPKRWDMYVDRKAKLPASVSDRIYLLGCSQEPEKLKAACKRKSLETLGLELSEDCEPAPADNLWQHPHLVHNADELARLVRQVKPFLFKP